VLGAAPLVAVAIALVALDEPISAPLVVGALLVVSGGAALAVERGRPEHLRAAGLLMAAGAVVLFASRDNLIRWLAGENGTPPTVAAAATLLSATLVAGLYGRRVPARASFRAFLPAGIAFGLSYLALFEAYWRGRVSVVSPLVATETLWGVGLSALLLRRSELVGRRLVLGALLIVVGGALIGVYR
jgi:drug/metabolite transporter (DMT)-like permease